MTNGEKIRQMSNEELAKILRSCVLCIYRGGRTCSNECKKGIKSYLDMEVEE